MIVTAIPYDLDKNLGRAYSEVFDRLRDDDWACFVDHDASFTTYDWFRQLSEAVNSSPDKTGLITGVTNRIGCEWQRCVHAPRGHDVAEHRAYGLERQKAFGTELTDVTRKPPASGILLCIPKRAWLAIGRPPDAFLGVDNWIHLSLRRAGYRVFAMRGLYLYHWYRADGAPHLADAPRVERAELRRAGLQVKKKAARRVWPRH